MGKVEEFLLTNSEKMISFDAKGHSKEILAIPLNIALETISLVSKETSQKAIETLLLVLGDWGHGENADCIIAEFEKKLSNEK